MKQPKHPPHIIARYQALSRRYPMFTPAQRLALCYTPAERRRKALAEALIFTAVALLSIALLQFFFA